MPRYPELGADTRVARALIETEYCLLREREPNVTLEDYLRRFPQYARIDRTMTTEAFKSSIDLSSRCLLERLRQPTDHQAWRRFVALYTPLLFFSACRMGLQARDSADLVQEVFTSVLEQLPTFQLDGHKSFRSWLRTIAVDRWCDHLRRRAVAGRGGNEAGLADAPVPDTVAPLWEKEFRQQIVGRALDLMQADFQPQIWKACWLQVIERKAAPDVATELGLPLAAVYAAKSRVLRCLRQELRGMLD